MNLVLRIIFGLLFGAVLGSFFKNLHFISLLGDLFVEALKGIAPILVFTLIIASLTRKKEKLDSRFGLVVSLFMISTFLASTIAVCGSYLFPQGLIKTDKLCSVIPPSGVGEVLEKLLVFMVINPIKAIEQGHYIGILFWALILGLAAKDIIKDSTKSMFEDFSNIISKVVQWIIDLAPFGIMGIVYTSVSKNGLTIFAKYGMLLFLLVGCMLFVTFVINPILVAIVLRKNPYPLLLICLRESGITAFFTRSSAANIPVNMELSRRLGLDKENYAVSIPLGATINMAGAAVTIAVMAYATAYTNGITVDFTSALVLILISFMGACGTSGIADGSLMLIPMACAVFGINQDISMNTVAIGFVIGVIQDSFETALNSSSDVLFAATAEYYKWKKEGRELPTFLGGTTKLDI